jgi:hypothetical protein
MSLERDKAVGAGIAEMLEIAGTAPAAASSEKHASETDSPLFKQVGGRPKKAGREPAPYIAPMPLSARMVLLRNLAEVLYRQWVSGKTTIVEDKLNMASRVDLGILCGQINECAQPRSRQIFTNWLQESLSFKQIKLISNDDRLDQGLEDALFFEPKLRFVSGDAHKAVTFKAFGMGRADGPISLSVDQINLQQVASHLQLQWESGSRATVKDILDKASRTNLGILCSLMNERVHPLRRIEFMNWLETSL